MFINSSSPERMAIFGINENRETCSIVVEEFKPFFYIKVGDNWNFKLKDEFVSHLRGKMGSYYENSLINFSINYLINCE